MKTLFPVCYSEPHSKDGNHRVLRTFGLQRSGQHLVIDWISRGFVNAIHLNHCRFYRSGLSCVLTPSTGRRVIYSDGLIEDSGIQGRRKFKSSLPMRPYENLLYSLEDISLRDPNIQRLDESVDSSTILILRDPSNWLASSIQHGRSSKSHLIKKRKTLTEYLEQATSAKRYINGSVAAIDYNKFITCRDYRKNLAHQLKLLSFEAAEKAIQNTPKFGGGSSFKGIERNSTLDRWQYFREDEFYRDVLNNQLLVDLSIEFFGIFPGLEELDLSRSA